MIRFSILLFFALGAAACGASASAHDSERLKGAIAAARSGSVIEVPPGDYDLKDLKISKSLTLRGAPDGGTVFRSAETTEKGILVPQAGTDLTVENVTFAGAKSWDRNGAGIRHEGRNLTVVNCKFLGNEDGILATGDPEGAIVVRNSKFVDSGFGDGQSHAIYVASGGRLTVEGGHFIGTRIGHHIKSLADATVVRGAVLDDAYGRSSYAVDVSRGGDVTIENNKIIQSANADNHAIVNYDLTRGGEAVKIVITGNEITNRFDGGVLLRNDTKLAPVISGNRIQDEGKRPLALTSPGSPKPVDRQ
ncbi:MAG: right-handed parallel beta-helix repeat-containing protein [Parvularculaceae bacterium]|nr:right-handed parallel beta-helix repeat-containing protein [Parvularculaceae bacterium]